MPYAVTHMLLPMLVLDILKHRFSKIRRHLPNRYVLIAGLAGLLPDIDLIISTLFPSLIFHRGITHTVWIPLAFLSAFLIFQTIKEFNLSKIFLMCSIGVAMHIILDFVTAGPMELFYPLTKTVFSIDLIPKLLPNIEVAFAYAALDAIILFVWIAGMALKKRVRDMF